MPTAPTTAFTLIFGVLCTLEPQVHLILYHLLAFLYFYYAPIIDSVVYLSGHPAKSNQTEIEVLDIWTLVCSDWLGGN